MQSKVQRNVTPGCASLAKLLRVLAVVCIALLASVEARPQGSSGRILGVVTDQSGGNVAGAKSIGKLIAERAKEKGIKAVVFDRGGYLYHGRVKALADAAREAGLEF